jgi:hypothetical protein
MSDLVAAVHDPRVRVDERPDAVGRARFRGR